MWASERQVEDGHLFNLPPDPTADADGSLPWHLGYLRPAFEARYFGEPPRMRAFEFGNEALLEIAPLLDALAHAARAQADHVSEEEQSPPMSPPSANGSLVGELVTVYEEMFGQRLGRSLNPVVTATGEPTGQVNTTGPAIRFYQMIFARLPTEDVPTANTIGTWIVDLQQQRKRQTT